MSYKNKIRLCACICIAACSSNGYTASTISVGQAYFQTSNFDASKNPFCSASQSVSVTTTAQNPNALQPPYRLRSWLGGMLWGTGQTESDYWVPSSGFASWTQEIFVQHPV